jgi:hypothetical protein
MAPPLVSTETFKSLVEDVSNRSSLLADLWKIALGQKIRDIKERCPSVWVCPSLFNLPKDLAERLEDMLVMTAYSRLHELGAQELDACLSRKVDVVIAPLQQQESAAGSPRSQQLSGSRSAPSPCSFSNVPPIQAISAPKADISQVAREWMMKVSQPFASLHCAYLLSIPCCRSMLSWQF